VLSAKDSNLVGGTLATNMETITIRVLRPFMWAGKRQEVGTVLQYPYGAAVEAIAMGKAARYTEPPPKPSPPPVPTHPQTRAEKEK
jgi:hypothetical protein